MNYRRLREDDLLLMRRLNEVFSAAFNDPTTHLSRVPGDDYLRNLLNKEHVIILAALENDAPVGGMVAYVLEKYEQERAEVYIYDLAVAEAHRRRGIARRLIEELKPIARNLGGWAIFVQADRVDLPAIKLYQSMGTQEEPLHFDIPV